MRIGIILACACARAAALQLAVTRPVQQASRAGPIALQQPLGSSASASASVDGGVGGGAVAVAPVRASGEWQLDFYSRPVQGSDGKKLWELLVTDTVGELAGQPVGEVVDKPGGGVGKDTTSDAPLRATGPPAPTARPRPPARLCTLHYTARAPRLERYWLSPFPTHTLSAQARFTTPRRCRPTASTRASCASACRRSSTLRRSSRRRYASSARR